MYSFMFLQPAVVEILLTHGVDPDASTRDGESVIGTRSQVYENVILALCFL